MQLWINTNLPQKAATQEWIQPRRKILYLNCFFICFCICCKLKCIQAAHFMSYCNYSHAALFHLIVKQLTYCLKIDQTNSAVPLKSKSYFINEVQDCICFYWKRNKTRLKLKNGLIYFVCHVKHFMLHFYEVR